MIEIVAIIQSISLIMTAAASITAAIMSMRNRDSIKEVHGLVNSKMNQLLSITSSSSKAEGVLEEKNRNVVIEEHNGTRD